MLFNGPHIVCFTHLSVKVTKNKFNVVRRKLKSCKLYPAVSKTAFVRIFLSGWMHVNQSLQKISVFPRDGKSHYSLVQVFPFSDLLNGHDIQVKILKDPFQILYEQLLLPHFYHPLLRGYCLKRPLLTLSCRLFVRVSIVIASFKKLSW